MATSSQTVDTAGYSSTARKTLIIDSSGNAVTTLNPLPTTATISGDVNVDSTSISVQAYVGKPAGTNADFVTARTANTTFTCATLPTGVSAIKTEDIELIRQITAAGVVTESYSRDDATITCSGTDPTTVTVTGAVFGATDTITIYTNIYKPITTDVQIGAVEIKNATSDDRAIVKDGSTAAVGDDALVVADANVKSDTSAIKTAVEVMDDWDETNRAKVNVNLNAGVAVDIGSGNLDTGTARVAIATDDVNVKKIVDATEIMDNSETTISSTDVKRVALFDDSDTQITSFGGDAEAVPDAVAATKTVQQGAIAETTVPTAVADGDNVAVWHDEYGRQISHGSNLSVGALDTNQVNQASLTTYTNSDYHDGVTADATGTVINLSNYGKKAFWVNCSAYTSDTITVNIYGNNTADTTGKF